MKHKYTVVNHVGLTIKDTQELVYILADETGKGLSLLSDNLVDKMENGSIYVTNATTVSGKVCVTGNLKKYPFLIDRALATTTALGIPSIYKDMVYSRSPQGAVLCERVATEKSAVTIAEGTLSLSDKLFYKNKTLEHIELPNTLVNISSEAFANCQFFELDMPDSIIGLDFSAFAYNTYLRKVKWSKNLEYIDAIAFAECSNLRDIKLPNSLRRIGNQAFAGCTSLQSVTIPEGIKELPFGVFARCSGLKHVTLPNTLEILGHVAFGYCSSLRKLVLPKSVTEVDTNTFIGCTDLRELYVSEELYPMFNSNPMFDSRFVNIPERASVIPY